MPDTYDLVDYGWHGFTLGLELGLSIGYIMTGPRWDSDEWKTVVLTTGIGALAGITTGIMVAVADSTSHSVPSGYYLIRDAGYGALMGGAMGAIVGTLLWVDDGTSKDVLKGAAWGGVIGAGAGLLYGIIEASNARPVRYRERWDGDEEWEERGFNWERDVHVSIAPVPSTQSLGITGVAATMSGKF
jgi:hypothetical protein